CRSCCVLAARRRSRWAPPRTPWCIELKSGQSVSHYRKEGSARTAVSPAELRYSQAPASHPASDGRGPEGCLPGTVPERSDGAAKQPFARNSKCFSRRLVCC